MTWRTERMLMVWPLSTPCSASPCLTPAVHLFPLCPLYLNADFAMAAWPLPALATAVS